MTAAAGIALALVSAATTASAHAMWKSGRDRLAIRAMIGATTALCMAPVAVLVPLPTAPMLPWLALAAIVHVIYQFVIIRSYAMNDFAVAYPVARGIAPIATAMLGMAWLGDRISAAAIAGIAAVSGGILLIAVGRPIPRAGLAAAIVAGLLTTTYTLVDAQAARLAPAALTFVAWFFILDGMLMVPIFLVARRGGAIALLRAEGWRGIHAGLVTLVSFGSALIALRIAPVGVVSALRETSVIFAMIIAAAVLRERVDRRHLLGAAVIVLGAGLIVVATS